MRYRSITTVGVAIAMSALSLTACGDDKKADTPGGTTSGGGGGGGKTLTISTDLPMQGASKDTSEATVNYINLYLESVGNKAGNYTIKLKPYDDSTAAAGKWTDAQCTANAAEHVATADEVAIMGTYNSGCAKIIAPTVNEAPDGPILMISHANTSPGLTTKGDPGEPEKYFPSGKRSFARVVARDDDQGPAGAKFALEDLKVKNCYILNDNETYGQGVANAFEAAAKAAGINVLGNEAWDGKASNYTAQFQAIKTKNPDCIYFGGIFDNNGAKLVSDKVSVLGDNETVKLIGPDGFTGYPDLNKMPQAQGMYLSTPALPAEEIAKAGGMAADLLAKYKAKYGKNPPNYATYGVAAVQIILAAIAKSDGTRKGVRDAVFEGSGITIPKDQSILGKEFGIDPATGDATVKDMTIELIKGNEETFFKGLSI